MKIRSTVRRRASHACGAEISFGLVGTGHTKASVMKLMKARISLRTPLAFAHDQQNAIHCQRETVKVIIEKTD
jgi:hypothetical protein